MLEITYFHRPAGLNEHRKVFRDAVKAKAFYDQCIATGIVVRLATTAYHAKASGLTGLIVQEWTASQVTKMDSDSYSLFFNGQTNGFGWSSRSPEEARERALAAIQHLKAAA